MYYPPRPTNWLPPIQSQPYDQTYYREQQLKDQLLYDEQVAEGLVLLSGPPGNEYGNVCLIFLMCLNRVLIVTELLTF